jgi:hypothetical protein
MKIFTTENNYCEYGNSEHFYVDTLPRPVVPGVTVVELILQFLDICCSGRFFSRVPVRLSGVLQLGSALDLRRKLLDLAKTRKSNKRQPQCREFPAM